MSGSSADASAPSRPTIYTVAARANVSIATVSYTYSKPERVAENTRERVLAAARELGYVPRAAARALASGRTGVLGFWTYDYTELSQPTAVAHGLSRVWDWPLFTAQVERGFKIHAWANGYSILVQGNALDNPQRRIDDLASRVDAIAVMPNSMPADVRASLAAQLPIVAIAEVRAPSEQMWQVGTDNRKSMAELTRHLLEVHGYRDLRFVGSQSVDYELRFEGFRDALRAAGLPTPTAPDGGFGSAWHGHQSLDVVRNTLAAALPDVFVCASDLHAAYAITAITGAGLRVPEDIAVTGFDDLVASEFSHPPLTTVHQPMQQLGATAASLVIAAIRRPTRLPAFRMHRGELILRRSCGCTPAP